MDSRKKVIYLQPIGKIDESILMRLKEDLTINLRKFYISVKIAPDIIELTDAEFNHNRSQYNASKILKKISQYANTKSYFLLLGIVDEDIYWKRLNFAFGRARRSSYVKRAGEALISITRLKEEFYNRPEKASLLHLRMLKEAIHELGHVFGLDHCTNKCIMQFSNHLAKTDEKPPKFCDSCAKMVNDYFSLQNI
jgi:archaemetzincin